MDDVLNVSASIGEGTGRVRVAAEQLSQTKEAYFYSRHVTLTATAEAATAAFLLNGMAHSYPIRVQGTICDRFANGIATVQEILTSWFSSLSPSRIEADRVPTTGQRAAIDACGRTASFFTGGVDSFYTLLKHREEIDTIVYVHGYDVALNDVQLREKISSMLGRVADTLGKRLVEVETDLKQIYDRRLIGALPNWPLIHGAALAAVAHLLPDVSRIYVPASYTYAQLHPWGSHPLLDPNWSSSRLTFVHDGCEANRIQKCEVISESQVALDALRVCWKNPDGAYNCGRCEKCRRTMINLLAVGALNRCATFDAHLDASDVGRLRIRSRGESEFVSENLNHLRSTGAHPELADALARVLRRYTLMYKWLEAPRRAAKQVLQ